MFQRFELYIYTFTGNSFGSAISLFSSFRFLLKYYWSEFNRIIHSENPIVDVKRNFINFQSEGINSFDRLFHWISNASFQWDFPMFWYAFIVFDGCALIGFPFASAFTHFLTHTHIGLQSIYNIRLSVKLGKVGSFFFFLLSLPFHNGHRTIGFSDKNHT